ncbi:MAG: glycosyltransferase family protein [Cyclobacteriaceae bacterium]
MKVGAIVQTRMSSSRLPGKVLLPLPLESKTDSVLSQVIRRLKRSIKIDSIIIATTTDGEDDQIIQEAEKHKVLSYRGSKLNVLERTYKAASSYQLDLVVRVTSDCPCIDPQLIDKGIAEHLEHDADFSTTALQRTLPYGLDFEIMTFSTLEKAYLNSTLDFEKEHVTPYIYKSKPDKFKIHRIICDGSLPTIRITLDTIEDYTLISAVYDLIDETNFKLRDLVLLFEKHPWLAKINKGVEQKKVLSGITEELDEVSKYCKKQDLHRFKDYLDKYRKEIINTNLD